jgi:hypothetical protein
MAQGVHPVPALLLDAHLPGGRPPDFAVDDVAGDGHAGGSMDDQLDGDQPPVGHFPRQDDRYWRELGEMAVKGGPLREPIAPPSRARARGPAPVPRSS